MAKISYACCVGSSPTISAQFTVIMCIQFEIAKNSLEPLILGLQGHSRSSMLTFLKSSSPVLVMISSISVPISNNFYAKRANTGKTTSTVKTRSLYLT